MDDRPDSISGRTEDERVARVFKIAKLGGRRGFRRDDCLRRGREQAAVAAGTCAGAAGPARATARARRTSIDHRHDHDATTAWTLHGYVIDDSNGRPRAP